MLSIARPDNRVEARLTMPDLDAPPEFDKSGMPLSLFPEYQRTPTEIVAQAISEHKPIRIYALLSGGDGSLGAVHWAMANVSGCEVAHIVTGIGIPATEQFVDETCSRFGWKLTKVRAKEDCGQDYEEIVSEHGFPGPASHNIMYNCLKGRAIRKLVRDAKGKRSDRVMFLTGICQDDSERRSGYGGQEITRIGAQVWVNAMYYVGQSWTHRYIAGNAIPRNPVAEQLGMSGECCCGAFAAPGELAIISRVCPATGQRIVDLQNRISNRFPWGYEDRPPPKRDYSGDGNSLFQPMCRNCLKVERI